MKLLNPETWRAIKFVLFSASAGIIELGTFELLDKLTTLPYWPCYLTGLVLSVLWNFTLNRKFTFRSAASVPRAMLLVALYYAIFTPLTTWGGNILVEEYNWSGDLMTIINMALNLITEFLYQRYVVYRKSIDSAVNN